MKGSRTASEVLHLRGCAEFRLRLALATLAGRSIRITDIRADSDTPGLTSTRREEEEGRARAVADSFPEFEACFLRLLEKITTGSHIEVEGVGRG